MTARLKTIAPAINKVLTKHHQGACGIRQRTARVPELPDAMAFTVVLDEACENDAPHSPAVAVFPSTFFLPVDSFSPGKLTHLPQPQLRLLFKYLPADEERLTQCREDPPP